MAVTGSGLRPLPPLKDAQARASDPGAHVWLSASAGTGKTQVLTARVFRLLLQGTDPGAILCLTFTKAGAAEMTARIAQRLAAWVRMPGPMLSRDLENLGEVPTPDLQDRARTLFARVLDAPGGGLRIQTIHGFCQSLLSAFPVEAGLVPGFRPLEPREEALLAREALSDLLVDADREGRRGVIETIGALSVRLGEGGAEGFLRECAYKAEALEALPTGVQPWLRRALELPTGDVDEAIADGCDALDLDAIAEVGQMNRAWKAAKGQARADVVARWLAAGPEGRAATLAELHEVWATTKGEPRSFAKGHAAQDPDYPELVLGLHARIADLLSMRDRAAYADLLAAGLDVGRDYARAVTAAKRRQGAVDFDDLIAKTVALLERPGIGEWVRYKLDQTTEHVLIDEAQDTNAAQWRIVKAIADEFFVGRGVYAPSVRTLFTVGDHKQAIFGFQGTDPINFAAAERYFAGRAAQVEGDDEMPEDERGLPFDRLSLTHSFRSTEPVLEFVDAAIEELGAEGLGVIEEVGAHRSLVPGPGTVMLLPPIVAGGEDADTEAGEEGWIEDVVRENARRIAALVRDWTTGGMRLESQDRAVTPGDVMILVKRRGDLARLLVARLYAEGVPVAGVDRLRLNAPLAVQDLLAAIRFVLQPGDDLSLASLLVSPLIGWTQDELLAAAAPRDGALWPHLQRTQAPERLAALSAMLAGADLSTPYRFLEDMLSGLLDGRRKLLRRLGEEARDPIDELLAAALEFESGSTPSLQRFLDWFDRGEVEIVRDAAQAQDAVRVMTAHAAKGLQAPLVILADATTDPDASPRSMLAWQPEDMDAAVPIFRPRKAEAGGPLTPILELVAEREKAEHWRLFYVAATRAEERLVLAGSLGPKAKGVPPASSWYALAGRAMMALGCQAEDGVRTFVGSEPEAPVSRKKTAASAGAPVTALPDWAHRIAPVESQPTRPLAPSSLGEDEVVDPPPTPALRAAAERGRRMHALFERLPALAPEARAAAAERWLAGAGGVTDGAERAAVAGPVLAVLADPRFADVFGGDALTEAPIAAVLGDGIVVSGTVDRLLVSDTRVRLIDFKTGRRVPFSVEEVPVYHLRQMAAYAAALGAIFPDRAIEAALLYTEGPRLIALSAETLALHKPRYLPTEQRLALDG